MMQMTLICIILCKIIDYYCTGVNTYLLASLTLNCNALYKILTLDFVKYLCSIFSLFPS